MTRIRDWLTIWLLGTFVLFGILTLVDAQQQPVRQTDPEDMDARQRLDSDIYEQMRRLDRQIQSDSVLLVSGYSQVVYLDHKYADTDYQVFLSLRVERVVANAHRRALPTTDSSFTIHKAEADVSTLSWMTIHKGD